MIKIREKIQRLHGRFGFVIVTIGTVVTLGMFSPLRHATLRLRLFSEALLLFAGRPARLPDRSSCTLLRDRLGRLLAHN